MSVATTTAPASRADVERTLRLYRSCTWDVMRTYLPTHEPLRYLYEPVREYPLRGGKAIRPALCIAACRAFGGQVEDAINAAAAIELMHSALLVHDDVADNSTRRRGRDTLNKHYGPAIAMNAGDALAALAPLPLYQTFYRLRRRVLPLLALFQESVAQSTEGQAIELGWIRDNVTELTVGDYITMTVKKTGWYTAIHPCQAGAFLGSRGRVDPGRFLRFGYFFGVAFQIHDDLYNYRRGGGANEEYADDIIERKRTLMLIHLLRALPEPDRRQLDTFLSRERHTGDRNEAEHFARLMREHGSIAYARSWMQALAERAADEFDVAFDVVPDSEHKRFIRGLIPHALA